GFLTAHLLAGAAAGASASADGHDARAVHVEGRCPAPPVRARPRGVAEAGGPSRGRCWPPEGPVTHRVAWRDAQANEPPWAGGRGAGTCGHAADRRVARRGPVDARLFRTAVAR